MGKQKMAYGTEKMVKKTRSSLRLSQVKVQKYKEVQVQVHIILRRLQVTQGKGEMHERWEHEN